MRITEHKSLNPTPENNPSFNQTSGLVEPNAETSTSDFSLFWNSPYSFTKERMTNYFSSITRTISIDSFHSDASSEAPNPFPGISSPIPPMPTNQAAGSNVIGPPLMPPSAPDTLDHFFTPNTPQDTLRSHRLTPSPSLDSLTSFDAPEPAPKKTFQSRWLNNPLSWILNQAIHKLSAFFINIFSGLMALQAHLKNKLFSTTRQPPHTGSVPQHISYKQALVKLLPKL